MPRNYRRWLSTSDAPVARYTRRTRRAVLDFELPAPYFVVRPILWLYVACRSVYYFALRVLICQPLFRAYCVQSGRGLRTSCYVHWIHGSGDLIVGDRVTMDGKSNFAFAARYVDRPTLMIGDDVTIGHNCGFSVANRIEIGDHTLFASEVMVFDASGHPTDPADREAGKSTPADKVKPVKIGRNVWVGFRTIILPGTTIGDDSVIAAGSVVRGVIPPGVLVSGNPGKVVATLRPQGESVGASPNGPNSAAP